MVAGKEGDQGRRRATEGTSLRSVKSPPTPPPTAQAPQALAAFTPLAARMAQSGDYDEGTASACSVCDGQATSLGVLSADVNNVDFGYYHAIVALPVTLASFSATEDAGRIAGLKVADILNERGLVSGEGKSFHPILVKRIRESYGLRKRYDRLRDAGRRA